MVPFVDFLSYAWMGWWLYEVEHGTVSKNVFLRASFWFALAWVGFRLVKAGEGSCQPPL